MRKIRTIKDSNTIISEMLESTLVYFRNIVFSYSIEYELFMGLILGYTEK